MLSEANSCQDILLAVVPRYDSARLGIMLFPKPLLMRSAIYYACLDKLLYCTIVFPTVCLFHRTRFCSNVTLTYRIFKCVLDKFHLLHLFPLLSTLSSSTFSLTTSRLLPLTQRSRSLISYLYQISFTYYCVSS